jgi:protein-tyrosine-phosphatase
MTNTKPTLLFVCVHSRSQPAAGLAALRGGDHSNVLSAGLDQTTTSATWPWPRWPKQASTAPIKRPQSSPTTWSPKPTSS